jgi:fibronectin-binding autotransporter adhesin
MAQNYTRQSSFDDGDTITASLFNNEFNQIVNALAYSASSDSSTGHKHDGNSGQGGNIPQIGDIDFLNKIVVDGTNNRWGFFVQVGGVSVEQVRIQDGAIVPVTDSDIDLGTSSLEFKDLFLDGTAHIDTLDVDANATVAGTLGVTGNTTVGGTLGVTGVLTGTSLDISGNVDIDGVTNLDVVDIDGAVDMASTLTVTGVLTGTSLDISGNVDVDGVTNLDVVDIDGAVNMATTLIVTGNVDFDGDLDVDGTTNLDVVDIDGAVNMATTALVTGVLTTTATQVATGGITSGSNIVSDTDSTDDLGTTSVRWANLFVDSITATDQITATGFTGTLDGILGSGAAAAATVTTLDTSGAVNLNLITDSSSSTSGALIVDGGVGIAKKLYVGTDLDVDGTTNLDVVDIDGAVDMASTLTVASNIVVGGTVDGRDVATDGTKLDGIEASATADQSNAEIRTAVEAATDSNVFTDADHTKLNAIEASATADQTDAEIRAAVEAATDSNVFTDADHTKLNAIEASADVTDTANVTAAGALMDSELTAIASVKALNQGVATGDSPQFVGITSTANVVVGGNLTVNGTTTTLNTATLDVEDKNITVNYGAGDTTGSANGAGLTIQDAVDASTDATILWDTTNDEFDFSHPINVTGKVTGTGTSVFASLDISGDIDVDGTTNLDVVDIDGAVDMASTLQVDGISTFTGQITANGGMELLDNKKLTFGTGDDLEIYHDGNNSYINDVGTGNILIRGANVLLTTGGGTKYLEGGSNVLTLFHTGNERLRTTSAGVYVTGTVTATGTSVFESLDISGGITSGSDIISDTDSTDSLGSTSVRWLKGWFDTLTAGTLTIGSGSVTDSSGAISFGNENLSTTGTLASGLLTTNGPADAVNTFNSSSGFSSLIIKSGDSAGTSYLFFYDASAENARIASAADKLYIQAGASATTVGTFEVGAASIAGTLGVTGNTTTPAIGLGTSTLSNASTTWQHQVQGAALAFSRYDTTGTGGSNASGIQLYNEGSIVGGLQYGESSATTVLFGPDAGQSIIMAAGSTTIGTNLTVTGKYNITRGDITISSGAITPTTSYVRLDTEGSASTDDLDTINGGVTGDIVILETRISSRDVVVKDGTGNLGLAGGADFTLVNKSSTITLIYDGTSWLEMSRSSN